MHDFVFGSSCQARLAASCSAGETIMEDGRWRPHGVLFRRLGVDDDIPLPEKEQSSSFSPSKSFLTGVFILMCVCLCVLILSSEVFNVGDELDSSLGRTGAMMDFFLSSSSSSGSEDCSPSFSNSSIAFMLYRSFSTVTSSSMCKSAASSLPDLLSSVLPLSMTIAEVETVGEPWEEEKWMLSSSQANLEQNK